MLTLRFVLLILFSIPFTAFLVILFIKIFSSYKVKKNEFISKINNNEKK